MKKSYLILLLVVVAAISCSMTSQSENESQAKNDKKTMTENTRVLIKTSLGDITVELYNETPKHRDNFVKLVNEGYYDGVLFHRVIKDFMVQTGDGNSKTATKTQMLGDGDPGYTIEAEFVYPKYFHKYGALAAARTGDQVNPERRSSGSQFYIVTGQKYPESQFAANYPEAAKKAYMKAGGTPFLDGKYTVFGQVYDGLDIVFKLQQVETDSNDKPVTPVVIESMKVAKYDGGALRWYIEDYSDTAASSEASTQAKTEASTQPETETVSE